MNFIKMHGAGNDFVILDSKNIPHEPDAELKQKICDRHFGVGCDQLIILKPTINADVFMHIYNPDGSEAEACGNATRCVAALVMKEIGTKDCTIETVAGILHARQVADDLIEVDMGEPKLPDQTFEEEIDGLTDPVLVDMGNPHAVYFVDNLAEISVETTGSKIETHPFFPNRTNVEFVEIQTRTSVRLRTWERGAGLTLSCGSAACATIAAGVKTNLTDHKIEIVADGGLLLMEWRESDGHILMTGPYEYVFDGTLKTV